MTGSCRSVASALATLHSDMALFEHVFGVLPDEAVLLSKVFFDDWLVARSHAYKCFREEAMLIVLCRLRCQYASFHVMEHLFDRHDQDLATHFANAIVRASTTCGSTC